MKFLSGRDDEFTRVTLSRLVSWGGKCTSMKNYQNGVMAQLFQISKRGMQKLFTYLIWVFVTCLIFR